MPTEGQKVVTEYKGFTITEKYFRQDPYRDQKPDPKKKNKRHPDVGWSFGIYGVVKREIIYYTAWSHTIFFGENLGVGLAHAKVMIDEIVSGKKIEEVSIVKLPSKPIEE